jgi:hypothetical protein
MYKQKNKTNVEKFNFFYWIKRRMILIIAAFMLGMSNAMYEEDKTMNTNQNYTEQEQKKD